MFYSFKTKYTDIFCLKNEKSFCSASNFSTKNIGEREIHVLTFEILMKH